MILKYVFDINSKFNFNHFSILLKPISIIKISLVLLDIELFIEHLSTKKQAQ
jgi:hypothetical protein